MRFSSASPPSSSSLQRLASARIALLVLAFTLFAAGGPGRETAAASASATTGSDGVSSSSPPSDNYRNSEERISISNMTCKYFEQPLNHFELPRDRSPTYMQRYCTYDKYSSSGNGTGIADKDGGSEGGAVDPVFFYTGNESPLDEYINNTGLIWELAESFNALVVFVEHRYEGRSLPEPNITNCMAYSSSIQALADYGNFIEKELFFGSTGIGGGRRPVIAFGGSYGGMLSAWMRMKYPHLIAGAIAASAPIFGFPRNFDTKIDTAFQVIRRALELPYPPTASAERTGDSSGAGGGDNNHCVGNLLASWPLMKILGNSSEGRNVLKESFRLCHDLSGEKDADALIRWAQSPWFDLAEGSFPYPSGYIVFALTHNDKDKLPAWPLQAACWNVSELHRDYGIKFEGNVSIVNHTILYGDSGVSISVDWDKASISQGSDVSSLVNSQTIVGLLTSVRDAVSIWFNVTKDVKCYNLTAAPNSELSAVPEKRMRRGPERLRTASLGTSIGVTAATRDQRSLRDSKDSDDKKNHTKMCEGRISAGSWPSLCCNEEMNLIITEARGLGRDIFWPPSHPRGTKDHADVLRLWNLTDLWPFCRDPDGIFGYPQSPADPWSSWFDAYYGGTRIEYSSNIVFSNGLLDPWSAAGVYRPGMDPTRNMMGRETTTDDCTAYQARLNVTGDSTGCPCPIVPGLHVQPLLGNSSVALIMEYGGHHTDLMYSSPLDPPSITEARRIEREYIKLWIEQWKANERMHHREEPLS